ncbi:MAG: hypothetical protein HN509_16950 [Halobacteriovoraceae bacterium]|jgi:hypothetical protein|nr:hypothetical protein [Halobacteriovoraceae bacterium]MBT5093794.1 hypothetical protein [Halobacteriovoraceae bacterium]
MPPLIATILILFSLSSCSGDGKLKCPSGTKIVGKAPPEGFRQYCGKSSYGSFTRHGPYRTWYRSGVSKEIGEFNNGIKDGDWTCSSKYGLSVVQTWKEGDKGKSEPCPADDQKEFIVESLRDKAKNASDKKKSK